MRLESLGGFFSCSVGSLSKDIATFGIANLKSRYCSLTCVRCKVEDHPNVLRSAWFAAEAVCSVAF